MNEWTREETIVAFNVYCKIPFKSSRKTHPMIIKYAYLERSSTKRHEYASIIKEADGSLSFKLNFQVRLK